MANFPIKENAVDNVAIVESTEIENVLHVLTTNIAHIWRKHLPKEFFFDHIVN